MPQHRVVDNYVKKYITRVWLSDWKSMEYLLVLNTNGWKENNYENIIETDFQWYNIITESLENMLLENKAWIYNWIRHSNKDI